MEFSHNVVASLPPTKSCRRHTLRQNAFLHSKILNLDEINSNEFDFFCIKNEMIHDLIFESKTLFCRSVCGDAIFSSQSKTLLACVFVFVGAHGGSFTIFHSLIG